MTHDFKVSIIYSTKLRPVGWKKIKNSIDILDAERILVTGSVSKILHGIPIVFEVQNHP